jgi:hypothetical protein
MLFDLFLRFTKILLRARSQKHFLRPFLPSMQCIKRSLLVLAFSLSLSLSLSLSESALFESVDSVHWRWRLQLSRREKEREREKERSGRRHRMSEGTSRSSVGRSLARSFDLSIRLHSGTEMRSTHIKLSPFYNLFCYTFHMCFAFPHNAYCLDNQLLLMTQK